MAKLANNIAQNTVAHWLSAIYQLLQSAFYLTLKTHKLLTWVALNCYKTLNRQVGFVVCLAFLLMMSACKSSLPNAVETVAALQNLQELATVEYTVTKVVKANDNKDWYTIGDRKILLTCQASIKAGIDLAQLQSKDISVSGKSIEIKLPPPKILTVNLPPENIKVAYSEVGVLRSNFTAAEKDALMAQAEKQMWAAGNDLGIINQAKLNTQTFMSHFLQQLGFENIELTYDEAPKKG
jgi:hypothetical protein